MRIYIAPMKALVQEMVGNFSERFKIFSVKVGELTGDVQMTKQQIAETQIIVTTPEKWDVITRKHPDTSYTNIVRLIVIAEIHLLHDERGPVVESIIARTIRRTEQSEGVCAARRTFGHTPKLQEHRILPSGGREEGPVLFRCFLPPLCPSTTVY
jgi:replicative superfamily II helicase